MKQALKPVPVPVLFSATAKPDHQRLVAVLEAVAEHDAETIVQTVLGDLAEHTSGADPSDDITLLVLKRVE